MGQPAAAGDQVAQGRDGGSGQPSFWGRMQTELLDRQRWKTRIELANAIFDYLEIFHNRQRRHSALGMLSPVEYERVQPLSLSAA